MPQYKKNNKKSSNYKKKQSYKPKPKKVYIRSTPNQAQLIQQLPEELRPRAPYYNLQTPEEKALYNLKRNTILLDPELTLELYQRLQKQL